MPSIAEINEILEEAEDPRLKPKERATLLAYADQQTDRYWRELRQTDFYEFFKFIRPEYQMNWHHRILADVVQRAEATPNAREMVHLPPRAGKSEEISVAGTAWVIGKHPEWKVLQLCLNQKLVEEFGRKTRDLIESDEYKSVFPDIKLHPSSRAVNSFATTEPGSKYLAAGAGGNIHGFGAEWCLPFGEPIQRLFSTVNIGKMVEGCQFPLVISQDSTGFPVLRRVTHLTRQMVTKTVKIKTRRRTMECTPNHPVWVEGKGFIPADRVESGDCLLALRWNWLASFVALFMSAKDIWRASMQAFAAMIATGLRSAKRSSKPSATTAGKSLENQPAM